MDIAIEITDRELYGLLEVDVEFSANCSFSLNGDRLFGTVTVYSNEDICGDGATYDGEHGLGDYEGQYGFAIVCE